MQFATYFKKKIENIQNGFGENRIVAVYYFVKYFSCFFWNFRGQFFSCVGARLQLINNNLIMEAAYKYLNSLIFYKKWHSF